MHQVSLRAATVISHSSRVLLKAVESRLQAIPPRTHLLFALSSNADEETIETVPKLHHSSLGCLSSPWPFSSASSSAGQPEWPVSCALLEVPYAVGSPFVSRIPGRPAPSVGRYHGMRRDAAADAYDISSTSYDRAMEGISGGNVQGGSQPFPDGLNPLIQNQTLIYFSDQSPEGLTSSLDYHYPNAQKAGLIASSTPFVTGHPVTLFHNGSLVTRGALGLGLYPHLEPMKHGYTGIESISEPLKVTSSQGNLVHTLNGTNPSKLLSSAITALSHSGSMSNVKEEDFYLGLISEEEQVEEHYAKVYTITSGDPSRGSLALDGEESPPIGSTVQLLRRSSSTPSSTPLSALKPQNITFLTTSADELDSFSSSRTDSDELTLLEDVFVAASENGVLLSTRTQPKTWKERVAGAWAQMAWAPTPPEVSS